MTYAKETKATGSQNEQQRPIKTRRHRHDAEVWEAQRSQLTRLYLEEDRNMSEIIVIMKEGGFHASRRKYLEIFESWGINKKLSQDDKRILLAKKDARRLHENKDTIFIQHGRPLPITRLRRFTVSSSSQSINKHSPSAATPPGITYHTPMSEDRASDTSTRNSDGFVSDLAPAAEDSREATHSDVPACRNGEWLMSESHEAVYHLCQRDFFDFFDENMINFSHLHDEPGIVHLEAASTDMQPFALGTETLPVLLPQGVRYWVAQHGRPIGPVSVQALGDMMQAPKECPVIGAVVRGGFDAPSPSQQWQLLPPEEGEMLRKVARRIFASDADPRMAHIEVCLVFSSSLREEDRIVVRFTASVHAPPFQNPDNPKYDKLKIECRRLRQIEYVGCLFPPSSADQAA